MSLRNNIKLVCIGITSLVLVLDQYTKYLVTNNILSLNNKNFILFTVDFVKNYGAAFSILSNKTFFLCLISILSSIFIILILVYNKNIINSDRFGLSFILGGCIGNGIDRVLNGYVVDYINLNFIDFAVFNLADIFINIGFFILLKNIIRKKS